MARKTEKKTAILAGTMAAIGLVCFLGTSLALAWRIYALDQQGVHQAGEDLSGSFADNSSLLKARHLIPGSVRFPEHVDKGMQNVWEPFNRTSETPVFWKVFRSGSTTVLPYLSDCLNLVMASEVGIVGHAADGVIEVVELESERKYVNVDTTTKEGLQRAKDLGLEQSGLADVVVSPLFQESVTTLFDENFSGRYFTVIRHPVERVASVFYYLKDFANSPIFKDMSLEEYTKSEYIESNFMVRNLSNKLTEALMPADVEMAKKILQRKFLIGLARDMSGSLDRIHQYFGWEAIDHYRLGVLQRADGCKAQYLAESHVNQNHISYPPVVEGSDTWGLLHMANWADVALYEYAEALYLEQAGLFAAMNEE